MDYRPDTIVALIDVLAWPILVGIIIFMSRRHIPDLLQRLSSFKAGPIEGSFRGKLQDTVTSAESIHTAQEPRPIDDELPPGMADAAPLGAIVESWILVERKMEEVASKHLSVRSRRGEPPYRIIRELTLSGTLSDAVASTISNLREARNCAVHDPDIRLSWDDAQEYKEVAALVITALEERQQKE